MTGQGPIATLSLTQQPTSQRCSTTAPLVLRATVDPLKRGPAPVIVIVNHLRSFIDIELVAGDSRVSARSGRRRVSSSPRSFRIYN